MAVVATAAVAAVAFGLWRMRGDTPVGLDPIPPVVAKTEPVDLAMDVLGRTLRHDFPLESEIIGHPVGEHGTVAMTVGERAAFRIVAERDCYVGIWYIDENGKVTRLCPREDGMALLLAADEPQTFPGDDERPIRVTPAQGTEYLHVVALSVPWEAPADAQQVPVTPDDLDAWKIRDRGVEYVKGMVDGEDPAQSPRMAEQLLALEIRPQPAAVDSEAENR